MDWTLILSWSFFVSLILAAIRLAMPVLCAILGEIITELSGVSNLGLEGVMAMGGVCGYLATLNLQKGAMAAHPQLAVWVGLLVGMAAGALVGLLMGFLAVTMKADQTVCGVTLVLFGVGLSNYLYRQSVSSQEWGERGERGEWGKRWTPGPWRLRLQGGRWGGSGPVGRWVTPLR